MFLEYFWLSALIFSHLQKIERYPCLQRHNRPQRSRAPSMLKNERIARREHFLVQTARFLLAILPSFSDAAWRLKPLALCLVPRDFLHARGFPTRDLLTTRKHGCPSSMIHSLALFTDGPRKPIPEKKRGATRNCTTSVPCIIYLLSYSHSRSI